MVLVQTESFLKTWKKKTIGKQTMLFLDPISERDNLGCNTMFIRVCRKTLFSSDQFETPGELSLGMDY